MRTFLVTCFAVAASAAATAAWAAETAPPAIELEAPAAARDGTIHECVGPDGSRVYTDEPCAAQQAVRAVRERAAHEDLETKDDWICAQAGPSAFARLDAERAKDLPKAQRAALDGAQFQALAGDAPVRLGPLGSAHVCARGREVKVDPLGRILVKRGELVKYMNDPATPAALKERCQALLTRCGGLDPGTTLRNCIDETPTCAADPPWADASACCPKECVTAFANATRRSIPADDAVRVAFGPRGCM
jgi:hypothetical protein